jgi:hypothetical protein
MLLVADFTDVPLSTGTFVYTAFVIAADAEVGMLDQQARRLRESAIRQAVAPRAWEGHPISGAIHHLRSVAGYGCVGGMFHGPLSARHRSRRRRRARGRNVGQDVERNRRRKDPPLGVCCRCRWQDSVVAKGRQRPDRYRRSHRRGERDDAEGGLGGRHHRRSVGAAAGAARSGWAVGALRLRPCCRGDECRIHR